MYLWLMIMEHKDRALYIKIIHCFRRKVDHIDWHDLLGIGSERLVDHYEHKQCS